MDFHEDGKLSTSSDCNPDSNSIMEYAEVNENSPNKKHNNLNVSNEERQKKFLEVVKESHLKERNTKVDSEKERERKRKHAAWCREYRAKWTPEQRRIYNEKKRKRWHEMPVEKRKELARKNREQQDARRKLNIEPRLTYPPAKVEVEKEKSPNNEPIEPGCLTDPPAEEDLLTGEQLNEEKETQMAAFLRRKRESEKARYQNKTPEERRILLEKRRRRWLELPVEKRKEISRKKNEKQIAKREMVQKKENDEDLPGCLTDPPSRDLPSGFDLEAVLENTNMEIDKEEEKRRKKVAAAQKKAEYRKAKYLKMTPEERRAFNRKNNLSRKQKARIMTLEERLNYNEKNRKRRRDEHSGALFQEPEPSDSNPFLRSGMEEANKNFPNEGSNLFNIFNIENQEKFQEDIYNGLKNLLFQQFLLNCSTEPFQ